MSYTKSLHRYELALNVASKTVSSRHSKRYMFFNILLQRIYLALHNTLAGVFGARVGDLKKRPVIVVYLQVSFTKITLSFVMLCGI